MSQQKTYKKNQKTKGITKVGNKSQDKSNIAHKKSSNSFQADDRFSKAQYDPKFMTPSSKITKVKIDKRFSKMLKDPSFQSNSAVDRYGRKVKKDQLNNQLDQYYYMEDEKQVKDNIQEQDEEDLQEDIQNLSNDSQENEQNQDIRQWMENYDEQSSSSIADMPIQDFENEDVGECWEDQSENVIKGVEVPATKRLALCNYDWMNISSKDLMLLFNSFKTNTGYIKSVRVYMSNIGKQKLELQEKYGPQGIWIDKKEEEQMQEVNKKKQWRKSWNELLQQRQQDNNAFNENKLRKYEKQRLKYFYAVIECDSKKTADEIYKECDGNQFENSNLPFDLRFILDQVKFDESNLKEQCHELPVGGEVKNFINRALGHTKVSLTWQDPQLSLAASLKKKNWSKLTDKDLDQMDWGMYVNEQDLDNNDGIKKIMNENVGEQQHWKRSYNKKQRSGDDIQINFEGGFDKKNKKREEESLNKQKKSMKQRRRTNEEQKKKKREHLQLLVDDKKTDFKVNLNDDRFKAVYENPLYSIDPVDPRFDHRKAGNIFGEVVKRNKNKNNI